MLPETYGNRESIIFLLKKLLPEFIFDISSFENIPMTLIEVSSLIDGQDIGEHRPDHEQMILNLKAVYKYMIDQLNSDTVDYRVLLCTIHTLSGLNLIDNLGRFRYQSVKITGAVNYECPDSSRLEGIFNGNFEKILSIENPFHRCIAMYTFLVYNQFFDDCNKRTARIFTNYLAIESNVGLFKISSKFNKEFRELLINMFNTGNVDEIFKFLYDKCFIRFNGSSLSTRQKLSDRFSIYSEEEFLSKYNYILKPEIEVSNLDLENLEELYNATKTPDNKFTDNLYKTSIFGK